MITLYEQSKDKEVKEKIDSLMQFKRKLARLYQTLPKTKEERSTYKQRIKDTIKSITDIETYIASKASSFKEELGLRDINYKDICGLSKEIREKLTFFKPKNLKQAFNIPGVTIASIILLLNYISRLSKNGKKKP